MENGQTPTVEPSDLPLLSAPQAQPQDDLWPWPRFPRNAPRNKYRRADEPYTGWEGDFLEFYRDQGTVRMAAHLARVSTALVYKRQAHDEHFRLAMAEAKALFIDVAEQAVFNRAIHGTVRRKQLYYKGEPIQGGVIEEIEYSDTLLAMVMRAYKPDLYTEKVTHEHKLQYLRKRANEIAAQRGLDADQLYEQAVIEAGLQNK